MREDVLKKCGSVLIASLVKKFPWHDDDKNWNEIDKPPLHFCSGAVSNNRMSIIVYVDNGSREFGTSIDFDEKYIYDTSDSEETKNELRTKAYNIVVNEARRIYGN